MTWFLRKAFSLGPFRLNLSKSGLGLSFGVRGARLGVGPCGSYVNAGRHGIYFRRSLDAPHSRGAVHRGYGHGKHLMNQDEAMLVLEVHEIPGLPESTAQCGAAIQELLRDRPKGFEYILFAEALRESIAKVNSYYAVQVDAGPSGELEPAQTSLDEIGALLRDIESFAADVEPLINVKLQEAFGPPGVPGDSETILDVSRSLARGYARLIAITRYARSMNAKEYFTPIRTAIAKAAYTFRGEMDRFPDRIRSSVAGALLTAETGGEPREVKLTLLLEVDGPELSAAMRVAKDGIKREFGLPD